MDLDRSRRHLIARLVFSYVLVAGLWIVVSDQLLGRFGQIADMTYLATVKGLVFVLVSSLFLYLALMQVARQSSPAGSMPANGGLADTASATPFGPLQAYLLATLLTGATFLLRLAIDVPMSGPMLIMFMLPISLSALLGGAGPGLLATALTVAGESLLLASIGHPGQSGAPLFGFQLFVLVASGVAISLVSHALHLSRQHAELALSRERDARDEYRILSDQLRDPLWRKDRAGRYIDCNRPFLAVVGRAREDIVGRSDVELFTSQDAVHWTAEDQRVMDSLQPVELEEYWPAPALKGWMLVTKSPVLDADGRCIGTLGIARDINRRREVEQTLKENEALFRTLFEIGQDALLIAPLHNAGSGPFIEANAEALRLFTYPRRTLLGKKLADLLEIESGESPAALLQEVMREGRAQRVTTARAADGRLFPVELSIIRFEQYSAGGFAAMIAMRDISARLASEAEQARLHDQVAQMQKLEAIGQLTGGISHDFNNLLATVLGYTELAHLHIAGRNEVKLEQYLEAVRTAAIRGRDLVSKMLVFSRGRSLTADSAPAVIAPRAVISTALELLRSAIPSSIEMTVALDEFDGGVSCDAVELEQLLMNLAINARDAIAGSGHLSVFLREVDSERATCSACLSDYSGSFIELSVADTGSGIAPHLLPNIFEPFFTTKEVGKGTGLGLALVHGIAHKAGGHIQIDQASGGGTRVRVRLPRVSLITQLETVTGVARAGYHGAAQARGAHLMVIDDELALAHYWRDLFENEGYRVSAFTDSRAALAAFEAAPATFDAVISDVTMPQLNGEELARAMLNGRADLPVFLLSGNLAGFDAQAVASLGVRQCFKKPVDSADILSAVAGALPQMRRLTTRF